MPMVDGWWTCIYGCVWVCRDIIVGLGIGRRQNEPRVAVVSRACTPEQPKDDQKSRFVEEGKGMLVGSRVHTGEMSLGRKHFKKIHNQRRKQKNKRNGKERTDSNHTHTAKHNNTTHNSTTKNR